MSDQKDEGFFISYTGSDVAWAEWIDWHLRRNNLHTIMQKYDFEAGGNFIKAMHDALRTYPTLAVLSERYFKSPFCTDEWTSALKKQHEKGKRQLILVRTEDCEVEGILGPISYIDLVGLDKDRAAKRLLEGIAGSERPIEEPDYPGLKAASAPGFPGEFPEIWNIPHLRNRNFVGRVEILEQLHESLNSGNKTALTQAIKGLGGVGKTQLALEYAYRYKTDYSCIWWLRSEDPSVLAADYAELAGKLKLPEAEAKELDITVKAVRHALGRRDKWLLIFDNAITPESLFYFIPQGDYQRILLTSREHNWDSIAKPLDINVMTRRESVEFLKKRIGNSDDASINTLAGALGDLPLALEQAAAYINATSMSIESYKKLFEAAGAELLNRGIVFDYPKKVATTWNVSFQKLSSSASQLLNLCAFLAPDKIPLSDIISGAEYLTESLGRDVSNPILCQDLRMELQRYSLVTIEGDTISVHRLVQEINRNRLAEQDQKSWANTAIRIINKAFPSDSNDVTSWYDCERLTSHVLAVCRHADTYKITSDAVSSLLNNHALYLYVRASYKEAEPMMRRALEIDESSLGPDDPIVAVRLNNLAQLLQDTNRTSEAEPMMRRALEIDESSYGPDHPRVAIHLTNLAGLLQASNRVSEAEPMMRRALEIDEASLGPDHPDVAIDLNNLALLLQDTNRVSEAEPMMRRALEIHEVSLGRDHPRVAIDLKNLARLLQATNRMSEAEPMMRRALEIDEASFGRDHPRVARDLNDLAQLLKATNRISEAESMMRRTLEIDEASLGRDHPDVARDLNNLAQLLQATNRVSEAVPMMRRALEIFKESFGPGHPYTQTVANNIKILVDSLPTKKETG